MHQNKNNKKKHVFLQNGNCQNLVTGVYYVLTTPTWHCWMVSDVCINQVLFCFLLWGDGCGGEEEAAAGDVSVWINEYWYFCNAEIFRGMPGMETQRPQVPSALRPKQPNFPMKLKINASGKYQKLFISRAAETLGFSQHERLKDLQKFQSDNIILLCKKGFFVYSCFLFGSQKLSWKAT